MPDSGGGGGPRKAETQNVDEVKYGNDKFGEHGLC